MAPEKSEICFILSIEATTLLTLTIAHGRQGGNNRGKSTYLLFLIAHNSFNDF